jgi:hypothetical protein
MKLVTSVEETMNLVDSFVGSSSDFELWMPDELNDPVGVNMAIITDRVLAREWEPNGFSQENGYRIYRYKDWESEQ